jgi:rRNA maturation protein Nop10
MPRGATKVRKMSYWKALAHCITIGIGMMVMSFIILFPLLLLGMLLVVTSPIMAFFLLEGDCPYCGNVNVIVPPKTTVKCRHCKQRSVLKEMSLLPLNNFSVKS